MMIVERTFIKTAPEKVHAFDPMESKMRDGIDVGIDLFFVRDITDLPDGVFWATRQIDKETGLSFGVILVRRVEFPQ